MNVKSTDSSITFCELRWDTEFFGVTCAKAVLHNAVSQKDWNELKRKFNEYQFVSIENRNSEPSNAQVIGTDIKAFLADVNIQFTKKVEVDCMLPETVRIFQAMKRDDKILELANFSYSKFKEDPELKKRGGTEVYRHWMINSFEKEDKFYAIAKEANGEVNGFLLHSYKGKTCKVELIAVSVDTTNGGIGTNLFKALEYSANQHGCEAIRVGTQLRNTRAINFYHKIGCKHEGSHQIYHLWNI